MSRIADTMAWTVVLVGISIAAGVVLWTQYTLWQEMTTRDRFMITFIIVFCLVVGLALWWVVR